MNTKWRLSLVATETVHLADLFASGPEAVGSEMAGRAEQLVGDPAVVAASVSALAADLLESVAERE